MNIFEYTSWHRNVNIAVKMFLEIELLDPSLGAFWILTGWQQSLTWSSWHHPVPLQCSLHTAPRLAFSHTDPLTSPANSNTSSASSVPAAPGCHAQRWHPPSSLASSLVHTSLPHIHALSYPCPGSLLCLLPVVSSACAIVLSHLYVVAYVHCSRPSVQPLPLPVLSSHRTWHTVTHNAFHWGSTVLCWCLLQKSANSFLFVSLVPSIEPAKYQEKQ